MAESLLCGQAELQLADGTLVPTSSVLSPEKDYLMIYFSAHWCGPCRGFTPALNEWVGKHASAHRCAVVFATADRSEKDAQSYFRSSMPNFSAALPYGCAALEELDSKFKVEGIPTLVVVDAKTGELITSEGREGVSEAPEAFPWRPRAPLDILRDAGEVIAADGTVTPMAAFLQRLTDTPNSRLALYFSAHWCPPCRAFTPKAAAWFSSDAMAAERAKGAFDMLFISSDKDEGQFDEYRKEMPWVSLPLKFRDVKKALSSTFSVTGIPSLILLNKLAVGGSVEQADAVTKVRSAPAEYPWPPAPWTSLDESDINSFPTLIALVDDTEDVSMVAAAKAALVAAATARFVDGEPSSSMRFALGTSDDELCDRVRDFLKLKPAKTPQFVLVNVRKGGRFVLPGGVPSSAALEAWLADFAADKLTPHAGNA